VFTFRDVSARWVRSSRPPLASDGGVSLIVRMLPSNRRRAASIPPGSPVPVNSRRRPCGSDLAATRKHELASVARLRCVNCGYCCRDRHQAEGNTVGFSLSPDGSRSACSSGDRDHSRLRCLPCTFPQLGNDCKGRQRGYSAVIPFWRHRRPNESTLSSRRHEVLRGTADTRFSKSARGFSPSHDSSRLSAPA